MGRESPQGFEGCIPGHHILLHREGKHIPTRLSHADRGLPAQRGFTQGEGAQEITAEVLALTLAPQQVPAPGRLAVCTPPVMQGLGAQLTSCMPCGLPAHDGGTTSPLQTRAGCVHPAE